MDKKCPWQTIPRGPSHQLEGHGRSGETSKTKKGRLPPLQVASTLTALALQAAHSAVSGQTVRCTKGCAFSAWLVPLLLDLLEEAAWNSGSGYQHTSSQRSGHSHRGCVHSLRYRPGAGSWAPDAVTWH